MIGSAERLQSLFQYRSCLGHVCNPGIDTCISIKTLVPSLSFQIAAQGR
jgi:hypothetical protein